VKAQIFGKHQGCERGVGVSFGSNLEWHLETGQGILIDMKYLYKKRLENIS
jgi:hypothetical protein